MNNYVYNEYELGCGGIRGEYTNKPFGYGKCCGCCRSNYYIVKGVVEVERANGGCGCPCRNYEPYYNNYNNVPNGYCGMQNNRCKQNCNQCGIVNAICLLKLFM